MEPVTAIMAIIGKLAFNKLYKGYKEDKLYEKQLVQRLTTIDDILTKEFGKERYQNMTEQEINKFLCRVTSSSMYIGNMHLEEANKFISNYPKYKAEQDRTRLLGKFASDDDFIKEALLACKEIIEGTNKYSIFMQKDYALYLLKSNNYKYKNIGVSAMAEIIDIKTFRKFFTERILETKHLTRIFQSLSILIISMFIFCSCERPMPFHRGIWGDWDAGMYADERYNMTLWMFKENWFDGKSKQYIQEELSGRFVKEIKDNAVSYPVKFTNGFMERWNIDYIQRDLGILTIYFENDTVIKAEYKERKNVDSEYKLKKTWSK